MRYASRTTTGYLTADYFPTGVKWLLIGNVALFFVYVLLDISGSEFLFSPFKLWPREGFHFWQPVTYMFLHDPTGIFHILFNMLCLWMFGADLERSWGRDRFLKYYFFCGIAAGVCSVVANRVLSQPEVPTIGASGAIYGVLLAYGMTFPDRIVLFAFLFPMKAKYFVMLIGAIDFYGAIRTPGGPVSHIAHLGGLLFGYLYLRQNLGAMRFTLGTTLRKRYQQYRIDRAKRKFQIYMKKQDRDRTIH